MSVCQTASKIVACWSERTLTLYFSTKLLCSETWLATGKRKIISYWAASPSFIEEACHWLLRVPPFWIWFLSLLRTSLIHNGLFLYLHFDWLSSRKRLFVIGCKGHLLKWQRPLLTAATPPCQALLRCIILIGCGGSHLIGPIHMLLFPFCMGKKEKTYGRIPAHCFQEQFYACMTESMSVSNSGHASKNFDIFQNWH